MLKIPLKPKPMTFELVGYLYLITDRPLSSKNLLKFETARDNAD